MSPAAEVLKRLLSEIPKRRDWLDPALETMAKAIIADEERDDAAIAPLSLAQLEEMKTSTLAAFDQYQEDGQRVAALIRQTFPIGARIVASGTHRALDPTEAVVKQHARGSDEPITLLICETDSGMEWHIDIGDADTQISLLSHPAKK